MKISELEIESTFTSEDGRFKFTLDKTLEEPSRTIYIGTISVPNLVIKNRIVSGELKGCIIKFPNGEISLDFETDDNDIFDFVNGLEYELDLFIDQIVNVLKNNFKS